MAGLLVESSQNSPQKPLGDLSSHDLGFRPPCTLDANPAISAQGASLLFLASSASPLFHRFWDPFASFRSSFRRFFRSHLSRPFPASPPCLCEARHAQTRAFPQPSMLRPHRGVLRPRSLPSQCPHDPTLSFCASFSFTFLALRSCFLPLFRRRWLDPSPGSLLGARRPTSRSHVCCV